MDQKMGLSKSQFECLQNQIKIRFHYLIIPSDYLIIE